MPLFGGSQFRLLVTIEKRVKMDAPDERADDRYRHAHIGRHAA